MTDNKFPEFCQWEITSRCDNNCNGCNVYKFPEKEPISYNIAVETVDVLAELGIKRLEFIGGEPTSYPYLTDLIKYIAENKMMNFMVLTNALNLEKLVELKPFLSLKNGLVVSINYPEMHCRYMISKNKDIGMVKKSLSGWKALRKYSKYCSVRVNCVIDRINVFTFPEIACEVIKQGGIFSFCPMLYKRQGFDSGVNLTFRSDIIGLALLEENRKTLEKSILEIKKLKEKYPNKIASSLEYIEFLINACKNPEDKYPMNCKGLGLPYLRLSSFVGISKEGRESVLLRACSDILGKKMNKITVLDLLKPEIRNNLGKIYQTDNDVEKCQEYEGCMWNVTFVLKSLINK